MTIPQLNAEIRRLEPIAEDLWEEQEKIRAEALRKWLTVTETIKQLKSQRAALVEQITSDTATATV